MKLFMFYVGGDCANSNIELHDVRFSIGSKFEDCFDDLRAQWWGSPKSLHLDCWGAIEQADGHDVSLISGERHAGENRLFFLNLGGYDAGDFIEAHRNVLIVAPDTKSAISKGLSQVRGWKLPHRDSAFDVEKAIDVCANTKMRGYSLMLQKAKTVKPFEFTCKYLKLS